MARAILEVFFGAKSDQLRKELESAKRSVGDFKDSVGMLAPTLAGAFTVAGLAAFSKSMIESGAKTYDLAQRLGVSTTLVQQFGYAADQTGTDVETLIKAVLKAQSSIANGGVESAKFSKALDMLGLKAKDLESIAPDEFIKRVADAFANASDRGQANAAVVSLFGSKMSAIIPLLAQGREGIEQLFADAPVQSEQTIDEFKRIDDQLKQMGGQWKVVGGEMVSYIIDAFTLMSATIRASLTIIIDEIAAAASAIADHPLNPSAAWDEFKDKSKEAGDTFAMTMHEGMKLAGAFDLPAEKVKEYQDRLAEVVKREQELLASTKGKGASALSPEEKDYLKALKDEREGLEKALTDANQPLKPKAKFGVNEQDDGEKARQKATEEIARIEKEITAERKRQAEIGESDEDKLDNLRGFVGGEKDRIANAQKKAGVTADSDEGKVIAEKEKLATEKAITEEFKLQEAIAKKQAEHAEHMQSLQTQLQDAQDKNAEAHMTKEEKINDLVKRRAALLKEASDEAAKKTDKGDEESLKKKIEAEKITGQIDGFQKAKEGHAQIFTNSIRSVGGVGADPRIVTTGMNAVRLQQDANKLLHQIAKNTATKSSTGKSSRFN